MAFIIMFVVLLETPWQLNEGATRELTLPPFEAAYPDVWDREELPTLHSLSDGNVAEMRE
jgi:hypothetical protein